MNYSETHNKDYNLKQKIIQFFDERYKPLLKNDELYLKREREEFVKDTLENRNVVDCEIYNLVKKYMPNSDAVILDNGCGIGNLLLLCQKSNIKAVGLDIDNLSVQIAKLRLLNPDAASLGDSEDLPYKDNYFDIVTSKVVIEHVKNPQKYIQEIYRVLKPEGYFILFAPNYSFPWEGHYRIFWLPYLMPYAKKCLKIFLKLKGRDVKFLKAINTYITPNYLSKILKKANFKKIENLSLDRFMQRIQEPSKISFSQVRNIMFKIKKNKMFFNCFKFFVKHFLKITQLYHPIILVIKK